MQRRQLLKGAGVAGAGAAMGGLGLVTLSGGASAHVGSFEAGTETTITTDDGSVDDVTITVDEATAEYDGLEYEAYLVGFNLSAEYGDSWEIIESKTYSVSEQGGLGTHAGRIQVSLGTISLLDNSSWAASDFEASTDGESNTTDVTYNLEMFVETEQGGAFVSADRNATLTYTVNNQKWETDVGGHSEGGLDGEDQSPG